MGILNAHDLVAWVVYPFKVRRWSKIEHESDLVVRGIQFDQMLDAAQWGQGSQVVAWNVYILQINVLLDAIDGAKRSFRDWKAQKGMTSIVKSLAYAVESGPEDRLADFAVLLIFARVNFLQLLFLVLHFIFSIVI